MWEIPKGESLDELSFTTLCTSPRRRSASLLLRLGESHNPDYHQGKGDKLMVVGLANFALAVAQTCFLVAHLLWIIAVSHLVGH